MKNVLRPALLVGAALTLVAGALAAPALAASDGGGSATSTASVSSASTSTASIWGSGDYLALGDSVPFGYNPLLSVPGPASRYVGYPELAAPLLHLSLTNLSCPGETTGSYLDATAADNGCRAFKAVTPLHTSYSGTQAAAAEAFLEAHPNTRLVTLMLGANDLFLCQETTTDGCTSTSEISAALASVAANLQQIVGAIRAHYTGRLVLVTYYSTDYTDTFTTSATKALDGVITSVAQAADAQVADGFTAYQRIAALAGGKTCAAHLLIVLPTGGCNIHPSLFGAATLAGTVVLAAHARTA